MAFSQSAISDPQAHRSGYDLLVTWKSIAPAGTVYQVYLARRLAWWGTALSAVVPYPSAIGGNFAVDVGAVTTPDEGPTDYSSTLPSVAYNDRALLTWYGGRYLSEKIAGFHVYQGTTPGGAVSYTTPVATVTAYPQGIFIDGAGVGGAGRGGAGRAASKYTWESPPILTAGAWKFGVKAFDTAGNEGTTSEVTVTITAPPQPPAPTAAGLRLWIASYNATTHQATLDWNASP